METVRVGVQGHTQARAGMVSFWRGSQPLAGNPCASLEAQETPSGAGTQPLAGNRRVTHPCYARSDSSGPSVGALVPLRKKDPYKTSTYLGLLVAILLLLLE